MERNYEQTSEPLRGNDGRLTGLDSRFDALEKKIDAWDRRMVFLMIGYWTTLMLAIFLHKP